MMVRNASKTVTIVDVFHLSVVRIAAAVHETLSPFMTEMRENLAAVARKVDSLSRDLEDHKNKTEAPRCGGTGWRRVVYLNMTDPNTNCPSGWNLTPYSKRTCGKVSISRLSCDSVFFPVSGGDYTSVCGSIRAYQFSAVDAFQAYHERKVTTVNGAYVAGISLTHGNPRQHIWTFAAGYSEDLRTRNDVCPCDASINITIPPFMGGDYFCESGVYFGSALMALYPEDPLWDGEGCSSSSSCCSFNNPPYFTKQLPSPTSDPIEARLCRLEGDDDSPIEFMELYVK